MMVIFEMPLTYHMIPNTSGTKRNIIFDNLLYYEAKQEQLFKCTLEDTRGCLCDIQRCAS